jgi:D-alanine-D-alanine ligase-like ATP-grasp enzyme
MIDHCCFFRRYFVPERSPAVKRMVAHAKKLADRLSTRDYVRIDFRADGHGVIKLLEVSVFVCVLVVVSPRSLTTCVDFCQVNPNPGWCWDGHLAEMAKHAGWTYSGMSFLIEIICFFIVIFFLEI